MSLPGNQIPEEALPDGGSNTPAQDAELADVWCRHDIRWTWDGDQGGYVCTRDDHNDHDDDGDQIPATTACRIEDGTVYGFQPSTNPDVWRVLCVQEAQLQHEARQERVRRLMGR